MRKRRGAALHEEMSSPRSPSSRRSRSQLGRQKEGLCHSVSPLQPPVCHLMEESRRSRGSSRHSSSHSSSSYGSLLHNTASLEPNTSDSTGVIGYPADSSIQRDSSSSAASSDMPSPASTLRARSKTHQSPWVKRLGLACRSRIPRRKGSLLVFVINVVESFAFYGAIDSTLKIIFKGSSWHETAITLLVQFTAGRLMYPIAGFLSDVYFGRYKMIQIGIWLFWVAFALLSLSLSLAAGHIQVESVHLNTLVLPIITFVLISAGSGAIEVTIIPFGVDQLSQGASSHEQSSYFYWFYFGRQLGNMAGILSFYGLSLLQIEENSERNEYAVASIQSIVGLAGMTFALVLTWWFKDALFKDRQRENPLREVANIIYYAATVKDTPPVSRRAFRYGEGRQRRIERAKFRYDGHYTSEEVEDVKTFCKILLVLLSLGLCFMTYTGVYIMLEYHIAVVEPELPDVFILCNIVTILIALPIFNFVFLPCIPSSNMRERVGFGVSLIILSSVLSAYLEWCVLPGVSPQHKLLCLLLPTVCVSLGELLLFVTGLEFIYAQSPEQMKGLLTGLFYLVFGLFSGAASLLFLYYPKSNHFHNFVWYFTIYSVIGSIGLLMYVIVACLYSNRDRPEEEDIG